MFRTIFSLSCLLSASLLLNISATAGELTPPTGPVESTEATLLNAQWTTLPYMITEPGVYRLTSHLTGVAGQPGFVISADHVTIDLNGFTLFGVVGSGNAIEPALGDYQGLAVVDGHISGWGLGGIITHIFEFPKSGNLSQCRFENLIVSDCDGIGIRGGASSTISNCVVHNCTQGITLSVGGVAENCTSRNNSGNGIVATEGSIVRHSASVHNAGAGLQLHNGNQVVTNCAFEQNGGGGIVGASHARITDCSLAFNTGDGITVLRNNLITGNVITNSTGHGIRGAGIAPSGDNLISDNLINLNEGFGVSFPDNSGNHFYRNIIKLNTSGAIDAPNSDAPMASSSATAGPWDNIGS